jgi:mutator protein MutT
VTPPARIVVTAAVIEQEDRILVTRRPRGVHLAGLWEFPGGKCDQAEPLTRCLEREILEELGTACRIGPELFTVSHQYPDRTVELHFFACTLDGQPRPLLDQEMRWVPRAELATLEFPAADAALIEALGRGELGR